MKNIFTFLLLIISMPFYSQVVSVNEVDDFTNSRIIVVEASEKNKFSFSNNISDNPRLTAFISSYYFDNLKSKLITLSFTIMFDNTFCLSINDGKVYLLLDDETKLILTQVSKTDCGKTISAKYVIDEDYENQLETLKLLSSKNIEKIRVITTDGAIDFKVKDNKKEIVKKHFAMLENEILKLK